MDTSIIVVIAIVVVFAVAVPAMIRKSATELSRAEIDAIPDNAAVVAAEAPNPGHDHLERTQVFHDKPRKVPSVPTPELPPAAEAPTLSLSSVTPAFAVIDGSADTISTAAEAAPDSQPDILPVAVGESHSAFATEHSAAEHAATSHGLADGRNPAGNVRMLHPAVHAVFNDSGRSPGQPAGQSRTAQSSHPHPAGGEPRAMTRPAARSGAPRTGESGPDRGGRPGEGAPPPGADGPQMSNPTFGADEEHAMTEQATSLRDSLKSLARTVRGFALVLLASVLGILVTSLLALFSVVHIALAGVFLGLGIVSLFIVRTLNLRRREMRKRLRRLERTPTERSDTKPRTDPAADPAAPATRAAPARQTVASGRDRGTEAKEQRSATSSNRTASTRTPARTQTARTAAPAPTSSGTAARIAAAAQGANGSTKAAQARAAMQRSTEAKKSREEADTGEIPLVRIRKEAGEGHTTRQVLLTGPIPVVDEEASAEATASTPTDTAASADGAADRTVGKALTGEPEPAAEETASEPVETAQDEPTVSAPASLGSDLVDDETDGAETARDEEVAAAPDAAAPKVDDPFMQRLKSRDGWSPTPLPVPSYVDAPEAEHAVPSASAADASSYETEARSREDIAAQFAAELGYRPELSDSAREEGPLDHGRKAIRTTKATDLGAVNDVLARRRA